MSGIPDDILKAAERAAASCLSGTSIRSKQGILAIAKAINAERERCWAISDKECRSHSTGSGFDSQPARQAAFAIREAIAAPKGEA